MGRLDGKTALVTGGARGLGSSAARLMAAEGARVVVTDVLNEEGHRVAADMGATFLSHDVASESDWQRVANDMLDSHGQIDILVNNAGVLHRSSIIEHDISDWDRVIAINQRSVFLGMRQIGKYMVEQKGGSIINVSSVAFNHARPTTAAYTATKFAIIGMTRVAAKEMGPHGIRVNAILPGMMDTPMIDMIDPDRAARDKQIPDVPLRRTASADEVAKTILFLASDESSFCTGESILVDGGVGC
ncbi:3alpha(or 20beta)-hydroxysteroid dehydrogenase [Parasphingorhabdus marina DSM 22363]|uniref:3alpha(Or 20beta)-hydroxysteroid dehydrogenase n=1 Tax=Parasphingorhabdus marina DSM 22363 TaxID=1123272 RepID=A0A1N6D1D8_9SPHN|nr:glucose 1-dehydrogenase [Parasphingorhabdus marina]SIN64507.1 3alpha(or 20beta)-hydroxysteroid dehydrogenase [Parasphingorhabdus marina DSM 22363]